ncbi:MAG: DUF3148 domain-containing protein, partial [Cyanobacteriota bacterium]|nr:DUF3148 domain-containing protein [Cyanobacteriota bacterium]
MEKEFKINQKVKIVRIPPYIKTAEPMPILRPANVVKLGEEGTILERHPGGYWSVRCEKGAFLLESQYLEGSDPPEPK